LVRESLIERERLLRAAPHIIQPLQFVIPLSASIRPAWMVRLGLYLYDHLARRETLPGSRVIRLEQEGLGAGLRAGTGPGFTYWDCRVQDARLVVLNAMDAVDRGAAVVTRTSLVKARREGREWVARLAAPNRERSVRARALVNAAGPFAGELFERIAGVQPRQSIRLVKGSHIVLPRLYEGAHAFLLQNPDGRAIFAIPFEERFTLVGTTDVEWSGAPDEPSIADEEVEYLLATVSRNFTARRSRSDIVWSYAGIRTLCGDRTADPSKISRDHVLELDAPAGQAPLLSLFGGKITAYRRLAEQTLNRLAPFVGGGRAWTDGAVLPGGDIPDLQQCSEQLAAEFGDLPRELLVRLAGTYGTRARPLLDGVRSVGDLGEHFGAGLHAREVDYLVAREWARTAEDVLFRRTKLGLHIGPEGAGRLAAYLRSEN
jgi:glycerol-3-phosphate dehydrogenase